ncbi:MAG TPA: hypothetical protein VLC09_10000 [Polyangiaceae bacterium]|nr:hypothetical protein [Polyangiaceae bacterium]
MSAYETAQEARRDGRLRQSRELLRECSNKTCHRVIRTDCTRWLSEVEAAVPSVIIRVESADGEPLDEARVILDGGEPLRANTGRAVELDPGSHRVHVEWTHHEPADVEFSVADGSHDQEVRVVLHPPKPTTPAPVAAPAAEPTSAAPTWPVYVFGGVGLAGFGALIGFGTAARSGETGLETCSPGCTPEQIDAVKLDYVLANVGLGVGIAGVTTAVAWYFWGPRDTTSPVQVGVAPRPGGALASVNGTF